MPSAYRKVPLSPCVGGGRLALHTSRRAAAAAGLKRPAFLLMMELGSLCAAPKLSRRAKLSRRRRPRRSSAAYPRIAPARRRCCSLVGGQS